MRVRYVGKHTHGVAVDNGHGGEVWVDHGDAVDLPEHVAVRLVEQGWELVADEPKDVAVDRDEDTEE